MTTAATPTPEPSLETKITDLDGKLKVQDKEDAKGRLASVKKISDEVTQAVASYTKGYRDLVFAREQSANYEGLRRPLLEKEVSKDDRARIDEIAADYDKGLATLKGNWDTARNALPDLQSKYSVAQNEFVEKERPYRQKLKFRADQDDLDALETQSDKEFDAQSFRSAYFLVHEMAAGVKAVVTPPKNYSDDLKKIATDYEGADNRRREQKVLLDQGIAAEKDTKKAYDDAVAKRRENILKLIADEPFPPPADTTTSADGAAEAAAEAGDAPATPESAG